MSKRIVLIIFLGIFTIVTAAVGWCGLSLKNYGEAVLAGDRSERDSKIKTVLNCTKPFSLFNKFIATLDNQNFVVLLQNNREIRTTGGFMGSFAYIDFENGVLSDWYIQDIYEPDGQIRGYVEPPYPIEQAFRLGTWRLPNSNWDLEFAEAARDIAWFLEKGRVDNVDGVVAINLEMITSILSVMGPIKPIDYPERLDADNFYITAQSYSENDFFPGSKSKRNYLSGAGASLLNSILESSMRSKIKVANALIEQINRGEVLAWSENSKLNSLFEQRGVAGELGEYDYNYIYSVENNLGVNKANCCIDRSMDLFIQNGEKIKNTINIYWYNRNLPQSYTIEKHWGGDYVNYQQLVLPKTSKVEKVIVNSNELIKRTEIDILNPVEIEEDFTYKVEEYEDFIVVGFWVVVKTQEKGQAEITYTLPQPENNYDLIVKKQPGISEFPLTIRYGDKERHVNIGSAKERIKIKL